jgi:hypothetical protein
MNYFALIRSPRSTSITLPDLGFHIESKEGLGSYLVSLVDGMVGESESSTYNASTFGKFDKDAWGSPLDNIIVCKVVNQIDNVPTSDWILQKVIDRNERVRDERFRLYMELKKEFEGFEGVDKGVDVT